MPHTDKCIKRKIYDKLTIVLSLFSLKTRTDAGGKITGANIVPTTTLSG